MQASSRESSSHYPTAVKRVSSGVEIKRVPDWIAAMANASGDGGELGRPFDLIPEDRNYNFEDVYRGQFGESSVMRSDSRTRTYVKEMGPDGKETNPLFIRVDNLEQAKRKAAFSFLKFCTESENPLKRINPKLSLQATIDQHEVLSHRVAVLNALLTSPQAKICVKLNAAKKNQVYVTYNRYVRTGDKELGERQSATAWFVPGAGTNVQNLLQAGYDAKQVKGLLTKIRSSIPHNHTTTILAGLMRARFPDSLVHVDLDSMQTPETTHMQHYQPSGVTSTYLMGMEGKTELKSGVSKKTNKTYAAKPITYRVMWGLLNMNILEQWQNPSTNVVIRESIMDATRINTKEWSNTFGLHIKILCEGETHVLSLMPFNGNETSSVTHMQFTNHNNESIEENGILSQPNNTAQVQCIPQGQVLPMESYVCLGAHRDVRYNEAQLGYIHSQGLRAHVTAGRLKLVDLPVAKKIVWEGKTPPAKSTRISSRDYDVMATSYMAGPITVTTITVVNYPPFGTQFDVHRHPLKVPKVLPVPRAARPPTGMQSSLYEDEEDEEQQEAGLQADPTWRDYNALDAPPRPQARVEEGGVPDPVPPLYQKVRRETARRHTNNKGWKMIPDTKAGQFYFVDGVVDSPFTRDSRVYLFDVGDGSETMAAMEKALEIRNRLIREFGETTAWNAADSFYANIAHNEKVGLGGRTPGATWRNYWQQYIRGCIRDNWDDVNKQYKTGTFWFTKKADTWALIDPNNAEIRESYRDWSNDRFIAHVRNGATSSHFAKEAGLELPAGVIPYPVLTSASASTAPRHVKKRGGVAQKQQASSAAEVVHMQARLASLEAKLGVARRDENAAQLMQQVLERLEDSWLD